MRKPNLLVRGVLGLTVLALVGAGCGTDSAPDDAEAATNQPADATTTETEAAGPLDREGWANYTGEDRRERLIEQAREEGSVTLYTTMDTEEAEAFCRAFVEAYPELGDDFTCQNFRAGVGDLTQRLSSEFAAGAHAADIVTYSGDWMDYLGKHEGVFAPFTSPEFEHYPEDAVTEFTISVKAQPYLAAYNTELVDDSELPETYEELIADDTWQGRIAVESTDADWYGALYEHWGEEKTHEIFQGLQDLGVQATKGHTALSELTGAGQYPFALTTYVSTNIAVQSSGSPLDFYAMDPVVVKYNGVGYPAQPPHPAAGMLFIDFFLGKEAQEMLVAAGDVVLRDDAEQEMTLDDIVGGATIAPMSVETLENIETKYQADWEKFILR